MDEINDLMTKHKMKNTHVEHLDKKCDGCGRELKVVTVTFEDGSEKVNETGCICDRLRMVNEKQREINAKTFDKLSIIQNEYESKTFDEYQVDDKDNGIANQKQKALTAAKHYANNFSEHLKNKQNIFIQGTFGTGKTHLAAAIRNTVSDQHYKVLFISMPNYIESLKKEFDDRTNKHSIYKAATDADLLILDDVGANRMTEFAISELFRLVDARIDKCTIYTTNMSSDEFTETKEKNRIFSRMLNRSKVILLTGSDYRRRGLM